MTNCVICQKQTDNPKWLILSTYMHTNITEKYAKFGYTKLTKFEINDYFLITPRMYVYIGEILSALRPH